MLETIFNWIVCLLVVVPLGRTICTRIGKFISEESRCSIWVYFWVGWAGISFVSNLASFVIPFHPIYKALLWLLFSWAAFSNYQWLFDQIARLSTWLRGLHPVAVALGGLTTLLALLKASGTPEIFDEGAYHLPLIRMWEHQGLVPGMANLNGHYGLNSTWHLLSALANFDFLPFWKTSMALNGLVATILGWFAAHRLQRILKGTALISDWIVVFLPFMLFRNLLSSPSTDIPAIVCSWFIFTLWLESIEKKESPMAIWPVLVILPFWTVLLKASSAPLLLIPTGLIFLCWKQNLTKNYLVFIGIGFALILPWVLQNWFLTGYAVFPVRATALGHPEWQVPLNSIDHKFYLEQFGAFAPPKHYTFEWLKTWFKAHNRDTQIILILSFASILVVLVALFRKETERVWAKVYLYVTVLACLITWLLTITEPRYGFGALVFSALFPIAFLLQKFSRKILIVKYVALLVVLGVGFNTFKTIREFQFDSKSVLFPAERPKVAYRNLRCGNFEAITPTSYLSQVPVHKPVFCWDCPFPCVPKEGISDSNQVFKIEVGLYSGFKYSNKNGNQSDQ